MIHSQRPPENLINYLETDELRYTTLPKLYSLLNLVSLESSGILTVQNQPSLDLKGRNVIVGFIDTGVDYTHSAFLTRDKRTRILALWDQNIQTGQPPFDLSYGCGTSCSTDCTHSSSGGCGGSCGGSCSTNCTGGCSGYCDGTCKGGSGSTCSDCTAKCANDCTGACTNACVTGCTGCGNNCDARH